MTDSIISHFNPFPTLISERLVLRRAYLTDTDDLYICMSNPNVCRYETWTAHSSVIDTLGYVNSLMIKHDEGVCTEWIIENKKTQRAIGMINVHDISERNRTCEMGFWLAEDCWGMGFASEAARRIEEFMFGQTGINKLICMCAAQNRQSEKAIRNLGMRHEGTLRKHILIKGAYNDIKVYSILKEEYNPKRP